MTEPPNSSPSISADSENRPQSASVKDWLTLMRVANLPSALANILMGYLFVVQSWSPVHLLLLLLASSGCLYTAGMVLNDVFDVAVDREQNRGRPIPGGRISLGAARILGVGLLISGVLIAGVVDVLSPEAGFRSVIVAAVLALFVVLYDGPLKRTLLAPLAMGGCRTLNILLGASAIPATMIGTIPDPVSILGWPVAVVWVAISVGVLIAGVTWFARNEAGVSSRHLLIPSALVMLAGLIGIASVVLSPGDQPEFSKNLKAMFPLMIALISATLIRRVVLAIMHLDGRTIQTAVISVLRSLIVLDAAVCFLVRPQYPVFALVVLLLLVPGIVLGKWFRET